ncbi:hypothetical protein HK096_009998 [Nowakowskiella sp. JEL0078]|nr:hypothetical protein HK096_009998 [Nowakowskiella sp. JEL0078]
MEAEFVALTLATQQALWTSLICVELQLGIPSILWHIHLTHIFFPSTPFELRAFFEISKFKTKIQKLLSM